MAARKKKQKGLPGLKSFSVKGIREDLSQAIYNISPKDTPFLAGKAQHFFFEWQQDKLDRDTDPRWSAHDTEKLGVDWGLCAKCSLATKSKSTTGVWEHSFCPSEQAVIGAADVYESDFGNLVAPKLGTPIRLGNYSHISRKVMIVDKSLLTGKGKKK